MTPVHTILHPTDFSEESARALGLACALARDYGARLVVLHVVPQPVIGYGEGVVPPDPEALVREAKEHTNRLTLPRPDVRAERRVEQGDPVEVILRVARELPADLLVMGTHGRTGLRRLLMGSVAEQVARQATCPVLTVTHPAPAAPAGGG